MTKAFKANIHGETIKVYAASYEDARSELAHYLIHTYGLKVNVASDISRSVPIELCSSL